MDEKHPPRKLHYAWVIAIAMFMMYFISSFITGARSIFLVPVLEEFGCSKTQYSFTTTIFMLVTGIVSPTVGKWFQKYDIRIIEALASIGCALVCAMRALSPNIYVHWASSLILGVCFPCILNLMLPTLTNRWFAWKVGTVMSVVAMAQGLSDSIFNTLGSVIIANYGWRACEWAYAAGCLIIGLPVSLLLFRNKPEDLGLKPWGIEKMQEEMQKNAAAEDEKKKKEETAYFTPDGRPLGLNYKDAIKTKAFWLIFFGLASASITSVSSFLNAYCQSVGYSIVMAGVVTSAMSIGKLVGKISLGTLSDFISPRDSFFIGQICVFTGVIGVAIFAPFAPIWVVAIFTFLTGIESAVGNLVFPIMTKDVFGVREYPMIWSQEVRALALVGAFASTLWGFVIDITGNYIVSFYLSSFFEILPVILIMMLGKEIPKIRSRWTTE